MFHTKGMAGFTLHPDKAYLEIKPKLSNLKGISQTFYGGQTLLLRFTTIINLFFRQM